MAQTIVIPKLGLTMEEGELTEWVVADGADVQQGQVICLIETDKATLELEAPASGVLHHHPNPPDGMVPVGTLIGYIADPGEAVTWGEAQPTADAPSPKTVPALVEARPVAAASNGNRRASPAARRLAGELNIDWHEVPGSSKDGHVLRADVERFAQALPAQTDTDITPVARRIAQDLDVNLDDLAAAYPGTRIKREHVEAFAAAEPPSGGDQRIPISNTRRIIAQRMSESVQTTAPVTLTSEVDATELVRLRQQLKQESDPAPSYNDILTKLVVAVLREHPHLNARLDGDDIVLSGAVHMGIAVDTERGLLVPVIRDAQAKTLLQIARESRDLIERANRGALSPDELSWGTFTISNLGMYGVDAFTPIINLPQAAILGVGRIVPKQVVVEADAGEVAIRHMMILSLTFDHRIIDGAPSARALQQIKRYVEKPYLWFLNA